MTINAGGMRWVGLVLLMAFYSVKCRIRVKFIIKIRKKVDLALKLKTILSRLSLDKEI